LSLFIIFVGEKHTKTREGEREGERERKERLRKRKHRPAIFKT
jgi:hypothetical protein